MIYDRVTRRKSERSGAVDTTRQYKCLNAYFTLFDRVAAEGNVKQKIILFRSNYANTLRNVLSNWRKGK